MTGETDDRIYSDTTEHLREELHRVDLLLRRHLDALWNSPGGGGSDHGGFYVSDEEVDRLLESTTGQREPDGPPEAGPPGETQSRLRTLTDTIRDRKARSIDADVDLRLVSLVEEFGLSELEFDALLLALAPDIDRKYEKIYGYLRDDITKVRPTVALIGRVLAGPDMDRLEVTGLFEERSTLLGEQLLEVLEGPTILASEVRVRKRVIGYVLGSDRVAGSIAEMTTVVEPRETLPDRSVDEEKRRILEDLYRRRNEERSERPDDTDATSLVAFVGPDEQTAKAAVSGVCKSDGPPILRVDARSLSPDRLEEDLAVIRREARLQGGPIHVESLDALEAESTRRSATDDETARPSDDDHIGRLLAGLDRFPEDLFVTGDVAVSARFQPRLDRHTLTRVEFPRPSYEQRRDIWRNVDGLPDDVDPETLASRFRLTRGQIEDAVSTARSLSDRTVTSEDIREGCRMQSRHALDELARKVEPTYGWDDIVVPDDTLAHLEEIAAQIRHRRTVYEEWGFEERFSLGNGINLLFTGPSGTGKTMAAEIIAGDVGLPMYKLDLSSIVSKYIGETEKNLGRVFDQAEDSNAILFFDEADALFGERTEVSDSHDRYANVEVDYLLQRMEEHDGCVIMATNLQENIDEAFQRRINSTVEFSMPDADARAEIWESIFPQRTPCGDLDVEFLSEFELSGGSIKNVALTAAFMAAEDRTEVEMDHLLRALQREFQKTGKLYDQGTFDRYRDSIR